MQLLAKNLLFMGAACWLLYIWTTGDNTYLVIAIALFLVTGFLLSRHGRKKQKPKVQNKEVQPKVETKVIQNTNDHKTVETYEDDRMSDVVSYYRSKGVVIFYGDVFDRHISGLQLGAFIGIVVSVLGIFVDETIIDTFSFISFIAIAFTVNDLKKSKQKL